MHKAYTEKMSHLITIVKAIQNNQFLNKSVALKGGTAINLMYSTLPRLSLDGDFNFILNISRDDMLIQRKAVYSELANLCSSLGFDIIQQRRFPFGQDTVGCSYTTSSSGKEKIKLEINYLLRQPLNGVVNIASHDLNNKSFKFKSLSKEEVFGAKLCALATRCKIRDLFDTYYLLKYNKLNLDTEKLKNYYVFFLALHEKSLSIKNLASVKRLTNIEYASELKPCLFDETVTLKEMQEFIVGHEKYFTTFTDKQVKFMQEFNRGINKTDLLFGKIVNHPAFNKKST